MFFITKLFTMIFVEIFLYNYKILEVIKIKYV